METLAELKVKLKDAWSRGKDHRIEVGTLLLDLHKKAKHGTWGTLLAEIGIPAQTARDYMLEASRQIHGIRVFENGSAPDLEAIEMEAAVAEATEAVNERQPEIQLEDRNRVKGPTLFCSADQKEAFENAKKENKDRVYQIFYDALMLVIAEQEVTNAIIAA